MNPTVVIAIGAAAVVVFLVPFAASCFVRERGVGWVAVFFPHRGPRWPAGIQEQQDVPWRWRGTEPQVDPPASRLAPPRMDPDASVGPVDVEAVHARIHPH